MPDVKNCPFCGKEPKPVDMYPSLVECETPGCILEYETFRVAAWNHRPEEERLRKSSHSVSQCCPMSEQLQKRVEELEAALKPFAEFQINMDHARQPDDFAIWTTHFDPKREPTEITMGDIRRARAAAEASAKGVK